jgi:hypothetical protein
MNTGFFCTYIFCGRYGLYTYTHQKARRGPVTHMMSFHRFISSRTAHLIETEDKLNEKRIAYAIRERKQMLIAGAIFLIIATAAILHTRRVLKAQVPTNMPANSSWLLTGHDHDSNAKLGLWFACWQSTTTAADHCRITDERGGVQYDGDMLPLAADSRVVETSQLQFASLDPEKLWVQGAGDGVPVPVLPLANGTLLVPVSDRAGLQMRLARGEWQDGLQSAPAAAAR